MIVAELEREASEILGPWNRKEYLSLVEICKTNLRLNRCLAEMGVEYGLRPLPAGAVPRMLPPGNVGSEVASKKSKGKAKKEVVGTSGEGGRVVVGVAEGGGSLRARRLRLRGPRVLRGRHGTRRFLREIVVHPPLWKSSWGRWAGRL